MTTMLTDRYIAATMLYLPARQREEMERKLRAAIADAVEERVAAGEEPDAAEYAIVRDLGEPAQLVLRHTYTPQALISGRIYSAWSLATRLACATVLPVVFTVLVIVYAVNQSHVWITIFRPVGITITVGAYLLTAITAGFALADRGGVQLGRPVSTWTPDQLDSGTPTRR